MKRHLITSLFGLLALGALTQPVRAQETNRTPVSLALQDAPVRTTLEAIFKQAGIQNYLIENGVEGFVTLTLTEQPMESALKLVMRASSQPLTYTVENGVWIVKPRRALPPTVEPPAPVVSEPSAARPLYERINLTYLDPMDLNGVLGQIVMIRSFTRQTGGQPSGTGVRPGNGNSPGNGTSGNGNQSNGNGGIVFRGGGYGNVIGQ